jgi:hypothetical protein
MNDLELKPIWEKEPPPIVNNHPCVWDLVLEDIKNPKFNYPAQEKIYSLFIEDVKKRDEFGFSKYKTRLQPFNGRKSMKDLYEELLDAIVYSRQTLYEEEKNQVIQTLDSNFYILGMTYIYTTILDCALRLKFMLEKKKENQNNV